MKLPILLAVLLVGSTFAAEAPRQSASMNAAQMIRGQVGILVNEVEDALGYDQSRLATLATLSADVGAVAKTVDQLAQRIQRAVSDQLTRVDVMAAKHQALAEELAAIDRIIAKLETEVVK